MALGAGRTRILRMLLLDGCKLSLPGIFLGAIGVLLLLRGASVMVFGSSTIRVLDVCLLIVLFFFTTVIATFLAAKRAARQDPGELLRVE
ncbi:MAG TPA: FtsX-like permease family protein, partial [Candidatus Angelobacter sp.]|nr:FtsX-like permease family protein [Candidatus Angelobacter sp.]